MEENANKLHFKCTDFNSSTCVTVYSECIYVFLIKILSLSLNDIVDKRCCDEFLVPQIYCKSKQVKEQRHEKFYLQSIWGKLTILSTENTEICR